MICPLVINPGIKFVIKKVFPLLLIFFFTFAACSKPADVVIEGASGMTAEESESYNKQQEAAIREQERAANN